MKKPATKMSDGQLKLERMREIESVENFDEFLSGEPNDRIIFFYALWCRHSMALERKLLGLQKTWGDSIQFGKLDVDQVPFVATQLCVVTTPTVIRFISGEQVAHSVGNKNSRIIQSDLKFVRSSPLSR